MSQAPLKPCAFIGCRELVRGTRYCEHHTKRAWDDDTRSSAHDRGYDAKWKRTRASYVKKHPLCELCQERGVVSPMEIVHHIVPLIVGGDQYKHSNLQSLCRVCHGRVHGGGGSIC